MKRVRKGRRRDRRKYKGKQEEGRVGEGEK